MMAKSKLSSTFPRLAALGVLLAVSALPAAAVVVDEFTTVQGPLSDPPGGATSVSTGGGDILGQRRGLVVDLLAGIGPVTAGVAGGTLSVAVTATTPDSRGAAAVTWDADTDPNVLDATGLAPLDLTAADHTAFAVTVASAAAGVEIVLEVYTDAANMSRAALRLPAVGAPATFHLSYKNDFVPRLGTGADFADVGAIVMTVRGTETTVTIDKVETVAASLAAAKVDLTLADAPIGATPQAPGTTFKYRVTITNTGGEALAVDLSDTIDANTTLAAATVDATPVAVGDAYETYGNVARTVLAAAGLLANDVDPDQNGAPPELTVDTSGSPVTTTLGGTATLSADGAFDYEPPVGVGRAVDTFTYTVTDNEGNATTATVKIHIGRTIWFVDDAHPGANLGTKDDPFVGFTAGNVGGAGGAGDQDAPGDLIFLYAGTHVSGLELEAQQELIGEGEGLVLDGETIVAAGTAPTITNAAGHGIVLASDNAIRGLTVGNTTGVDVTGSNFGTLTVANVTLNGTGGALNLTNGALAAAFNSISSTNSTGRGVNLDTVTGSLVSASTSVTDSAQAGIRVTNGGSTYDFGPTTLTSTTSGLELTNNATSTFTFASLAVTTDAGPGLLASSSGTLSIGGASNTIVATGGAGVDVTSTSFGTGATFSTVSSSGNAGGKGINLDTVTGSFVATGGSITGAGGVAFDVNAGTGAISYGGTITNAAARAVEVTSRTSSTVTLSGNISDSGTGVNIASNSGGTITLSGTYNGTAATSQIDVTGNSGTAVVNFSGSSKVLSTGASNAIDVTSNGTATVNFTGGGLAVTTTSGVGFNATGGAGGVTVQGSTNTLSSTTGIALNVVSTTIGGSGVTFQSISANGASSGIVLNSTGTMGGLTVTGTGSASSGGMIQNTTGPGISLTTTQGVMLNNMAIQSTADSGVNGTDVTNFTFTNGTVTNAGNGGEESAIAFNGSGTNVGNNIDGTLVISGNSFTNPFYSGLDVQSDEGMITDADVTGNIITNPGFSGVNFVGIGDASTAFSLNNASIDNNTISGSGGNGIQISGGNGSATGPRVTFGIPNSGSNLVAITQNAISIDGTGTQAITVSVTGGNSGQRTRTNFDISDNGTVATPITGSLIGTVILVGCNGFSDCTGVVDNNVIDGNHTSGPGGGGGNGIGGGNGVGGAGSAWTPDLTLSVTNNVITDVNGNGILLVGRGTSGTAKLKIANNDVQAPNNTPGGSARQGIRVDAGNSSSADDAVYLNILGNTSAGSNGAAGLGVRKQGTVSTTNDFGVFDAAGGPDLPSTPTNTDVQTFINALNPAGGGTDIISGSAYQEDLTQAPP